MPYRRIRDLLLLALVLHAATGCSGPAASAAAPSGAARSTHPLHALHAVLVLEELVDGRNPKQDDYHATVAICRNAGWPVQALTADQVSRLGTGTFELAIDAGHRLARMTRWSTAAAGNSPEQLCQFRFREDIEESYVDPVTSGYTGDESDPGWHEQATVEGEFDVPALDHGGQEEARAYARAAGWTDVGVRSLAGQPCQAWRNKRGDVCMWAAGDEWGLSVMPDGLSLAASQDTTPGGLVLSQEPAGGTGTRVWPRSVAVGAPLPADALRVRTRKESR